MRENGGGGTKRSFTIKSRQWIQMTSRELKHNAKAQFQKNSVYSHMMSLHSGNETAILLLEQTMGSGQSCYLLF